MNAASERMLVHFEYGTLPPELSHVSIPCAALAREMATALDSTDPVAGAEVTTGLRKLVEALDCFMRAAVRLKD